MKNMLRTRGFTLVEIAVGIVLIGMLLLAFAGMTTVTQRSARRTMQYGDAQQNARSAIDYITGSLRAAGSDIAAYDGQATIVNAGPYQVAFNADLDQGQVVDGQNPMRAIDIDQAPNTVPESGTPFYSPDRTYDSGAETVVLTLDSSGDGVVDGSDHGDDAEEGGRNPHTYLLKRYTYGHVAGSSNEVRDESVAMLRGPVDFDDGTSPPPLFEYWYNHDEDLTTPDLLWGDANNDGELSSGEIAALTEVPANLLYAIRMVKVNVVAEGDKKMAGWGQNDGFAIVTMNSQVWMRNVDGRESARAYGVVYYDANGNGTRDTGEPGIPQVVVTVQGNGRRTVTDQFGQYNLPLDGGTHTIVETDPTGYTSTTPNSVAVTLVPGQKYNVNFGDGTSYEFGYITGTVWEDADANSFKNGGEAGIPGVTIQLSNEMSAKTNSRGYYRLTVPLGSYTVTEMDLEGYTSTTPNAVAATIATQGDSVVVNFGDLQGDARGTLAGHVFEDQDEDGRRDFGEPGLSGVSLSLSNGASTTTDASGYYEFTLEPGKYDAYELDPDGYTSTTPNLVGDIWIKVDSLVTLDFGDMPIKDLGFVEILVSDTDRPLSLSVGDLREDSKRDLDIVLGTPTSGGTGNTFFYINKWSDSSTPVDELFDPQPTLVRNAVTDVNAVECMDLNADGYLDVLTGQESFTGNNVLQWYNDRSGDFGNSPGAGMTAGGSSAARRLRLVDVDRDGYRDVIVGLESGLTPFSGGFDVMNQITPGSFYPSQSVTTNGAGTTLGVVTAVATGDLDKDGYQDLVVGSNQGDYWGHIDIFYNDGAGQLVWKKRLLAKAGVNDISIVDVVSDALALPDILVGVSVAQNAGGVQVWINKLGVFGVADQSGYVFDSDTDPRIPNRYLDADGEVLALTSTRLDADIYPEIILGTRTSLFYTGDLTIVRDIMGTVTALNIKNNIAGEVVTVDLGDFNRDSNTDIVVTTRNTATSGKLAIYFLNDPSVIP